MSKESEWVDMKIKRNQSLDFCFLYYLDWQISLKIIFYDLFPIFSKRYFSKMLCKIKQHERNLDLFVHSINLSEWHLQLLSIELFEEGNQVLLSIFCVAKLNSKYRVHGNNYWSHKQLFVFGLFYFIQADSVHVLFSLVQYDHIQQVEDFPIGFIFYWLTLRIF